MAKTMLKNESESVVACTAKKCCPLKCMGFWMTLVPMTLGTLAFFGPNPRMAMFGLVTTVFMAFTYNLFSYLYKKN